QRSKDLVGLQEALDLRFRAIRSRRELSAPGAPLYALEHGLGEAELADVYSGVRAAVRKYDVSTRLSLPFVVYATELGYAYSGDEYWPTCEAQTPGWDVGNRSFIRESFERFAEEYGGAVPSGAWAGQFKIICWPITHAVLPTDLQRQLARLLYESRRALT